MPAKATEKTTEPTEAPAQPEKSKYPETWRWEDDGDVIEGTYVELSEAHTRFDRETRPILILDVDGKRRTVWLFHTALQSRLREELEKRPGNELRVGEPIRIERLGEKESEDGFRYMNYRVEFAESPKRSGLEILGEAEAPVKQQQENGDGEPDDDIPF
jgi:hypothetical protein